MYQEFKFDVMVILKTYEKNNNAQIDDRISYERSKC